MKFNTCLYSLLSALLCLGTIGMLSCSDSDCPLSNVVRNNCTLYSSSTKASYNLPDVLTVCLSDSIVFNQGQNLNSFSLPMSYALDVDTLLFKFSNSDASCTDTVLLFHTNSPHFVSLDCAYSIFHEITGVQVLNGVISGQEIHSIDSVVINNSQVTYDQTENLKIYLSKH